MSKHDEYVGFFLGATTGPAPNLAVNALDAAIKTRNFEIELYWKRAAYFWTLIAVAFAGYFAIENSTNQEKSLFSFIVACIGFFFTLAWFFVNKGSKFWQENWENHVAILGDFVIGPLYRIVLSRPCNSPRTAMDFVTAPARISVSKINQWVSFYVLFIWAALILFSMPASTCLHKSLMQHPYLFVFGFTFLFSCLMYFFSKTDLEPHTPKMRISTTVIQD